MFYGCGLARKRKGEGDSRTCKNAGLTASRTVAGLRWATQVGLVRRTTASGEGEVKAQIGEGVGGDSPDQAMRASGIGGEGDGVGGEDEGDSPDLATQVGVGGEGDGVGGGSGVEGEGDGVGAEGDSPDLATQVGRRASGASARAARTQDDRGRGATSGEGEGVGRRARIGTVRDSFL